MSASNFSLRRNSRSSEGNQEPGSCLFAIIFLILTGRWNLKNPTKLGFSLTSLPKFCSIKTAIAAQTAANVASDLRLDIGRNVALKK